MSAWLILAVQSFASWIDSYRDEHHLTTDPACKHHKAPRPGSRLDRASRGSSCVPCMVSDVWGSWECFRLPNHQNGGRDA